MCILAQVVLNDCGRSLAWLPSRVKKANPKKQHTTTFLTGEQISFHSFWDLLIHLALLLFYVSSACVRDVLLEAVKTPVLFQQASPNKKNLSFVLQTLPQAIIPH